MVAALGGPADFLERAAATICRSAKVVDGGGARRDAGVVAAIDTRALGAGRGGARRRAHARRGPIDHAVG